MRCKPGDLAVVLNGKNIGRIVRVLYFVPEGQRAKEGGIDYYAYRRGGWMVEFVGGPGRVEICGGGSGHVPCGLCEDHRLLPLPGDEEVSEQEKEREAA